MVVASRISSADNAYFYIAATIGGTVELLAINMGASLTVEGAHDPARLGRNARAAVCRRSCGCGRYGRPARRSRTSPARVRGCRPPIP
ncbi:hypothetical protein GCM10009612_41650 [Streptomyces beijiangensis]